MKPVPSRFYRRTEKVVINPHFWAIAMMLLILFILYYSYLFGINVMPTSVRQIALFAYSSDLFISIFLIPVLYSSYVFRISGAVISSLVVAATLLIRPLIEQFILE